MQIKFGKLSIELDEICGRITSVQSGRSFLADQVTLPLFTLRFRDEGGEPVLVTSDELGFTFCPGGGDGELGVLIFSDQTGLGVSARIRLMAGDRDSEVHWRLALEHSRPGYLEWVEFPGIVFTGDLIGQGGDGVLFSPTTEGVLVEDIRVRQGSFLAYQPAEYPNHGWCGYYPGNAQMQFFCFTRTDDTIYLGAHDPTHTTKELEFCPHEGGVRIIVKVFPGAITAGKYELPYPIVMAGIQGDWQDAAARYRDWIQSKEVTMPKKIRENGHHWLEESPIIVSYPVTGEGHHSGPTQVNEYFPFPNASPVVRRLGEALDSKMLALVMHWEGTAPWSPPYCWPPRGGEEGLRQLADELHTDGHLLGIYTSGVAWTNTSNTGDGTYNCTEELEQKGLIRHMCRGPKGEYESKICNCDEIRWGYDICVSTEFAREVMAEEAVKIASAGVDYLQLFDQNLGGAAYQCYDGAHGHVPAPGPWQAPAMKNLTATVLQRLAEAGKGEVILGCEAAPAECYIDQLPLNDLRYHMGYNYGRPVPAFAFVFHEYSVNFMGNGVEALALLDHIKSPFNLMLRIAHSFCAGDLLAGVLKDHGEIHWSWCVKWDVPPPPQEPLLAFMKHLNQWRREEGKPFLYFGRMEKLVPFDGAESLTLYLNPERLVGQLDYPAVLGSRWSSPDGRDAQFLVNYSDRPQTVTLRTDRNCILRRDPVSAAREDVVDAQVSIPPLRAVLVEWIG